MTCVCGAPNPHDPPLIGCLYAVRPIHLYELPAWIGKTEVLAAALAAGRLDWMFPPAERDQAIGMLLQNIEDQMEVLEEALGGRD